MPEPTRWRKKPVTVEAMQIGDSLAEAVDLYRWSGTELGLTVNGGAHGVETVTVHTLEGDMTARPGDWIVKGVKGEVYPVRADIFADTYEPAVDGVLAVAIADRLTLGLATPPEKLIGGDDA